MPPGDAYRVLYPPDRSVNRSTFEVIIAAPQGTAAPKLVLGSSTVKLTRLRFDPSWIAPGLLTAAADRIGDRSQAELWTGTATARAGRNTLKVGAQTLAIHVGPRPPQGWPAVSVHPPIPVEKGQSRCSGCHAMRTGVLGPAPSDRACGRCHDEIAVQAIHKHVAPPLARCAMCHDPHGAIRPKLLTDTKERLCSKCHSGGHSKG